MSPLDVAVLDGPGLSLLTVSVKADIVVFKVDKQQAMSDCGNVMFGEDIWVRGLTSWGERDLGRVMV